MYTKTRSTMVGFIAASLFVLSGWLLGEPVAPTQSSLLQSNSIQSSLTQSSSTQASDAAPIVPASMVSITLASDLPSPPAQESGRSRSRMSLAMPYFSFALLRTRKGIN